MEIKTSEIGRTRIEELKKYYGAEILGVEHTPNGDRRHEQYLVYRYPSGEICVLVIPDETKNEDCCCSFGTLEYFASVATFDLLGMQIRSWCVNVADGRPCHPRWYLDHDDPMLAKWIDTNRKLIEKYRRQ